MQLEKTLFKDWRAPDYDSDSMLITDNRILINSAEKNYHRFKVPTSMVEAKKIKHRYNSADKAKLDINTSVNKIGEIVNLSQYLNSIMWENIHNDLQNGVDVETAFKNQNELYKDICILSAASGVAIDQAKKAFDVNIGKNLEKLKEKYAIYTSVNGKDKFTKPIFFKNITTGNGYTLNPNQHFRTFNTSMDYLQYAIDKFNAGRIKISNLPFSDILNPLPEGSMIRGRNYTKVNDLISQIKTMRTGIQKLYVDYDKKSKDDKSIVVREANELREKCVDVIRYTKLSQIEMYLLLKEIDKDRNTAYARTIFDTLFATGNEILYDLIRDTSDEIYKLTQKTTDEESVELFGFEYFKRKIG